MRAIVRLVPAPNGSGHVAVLPAEASAELPSRGMVMVSGTLDGTAFTAPLEPNGEGSHWMRAPSGVTSPTAELICEPMKNWPEPVIPEDIAAVLSRDPAASKAWAGLTAAARWDWIRWATAPALAETRARRVESIPSRLHAGKRRPCCFDRSQKTLTDA